MSSIGIRAFARNVSDVIDGVDRTKEPVVLTKYGKPVAAVIPLSEDDLEDFVLAYSPEIADDLAAADKALSAGKTRPLQEVLDELESEASGASNGRRTPAGC